MSRFSCFTETTLNRVWYATLLAAVVGCGSRTEILSVEQVAETSDGGATSSGVPLCPDGTPLPCDASGGGGAGGCTADLQTDPHHCGACGVDCGAAPCANGSCIATLDTLWSIAVAGERADVQWDGVRGMAADEEGGVFLGMNLATDELQVQSFVMHLDALGNELWTVPTEHPSFGLASRGGPLFFVSNDYGQTSPLGELDELGATLWITASILGADASQASGVAATWEGDALVAGNFYVDEGPLGSQAYVSRISAGGAIAWSVVPSGSAVAESVAATLDGGATATISHSATVSFAGLELPATDERSLAVVTLSPTGEAAWAVPLGAPGDAIGNMPIGTDSGGHTVVARALDGVLTLTKLDATGAAEWERVFGPGTVEAVALAIDFADNIVVAGTFGGELNAGGDLLVAEPSSTQAFVLKLNQLGEAVAGRTLPFSYAYPSNAAGNLPVFVDTDAMGNVFVGTGACFENGSAVTKLTP